jgi:hypothetical protein
LKPAQFEEKEYESPLYLQLERGNPFLWTPGQALENYLGYDAALFLTAQYLWSLHGFQTPLAGVLPHWDFWPRLPRTPFYRDRLPSFRFNCFVQAKRCAIGQRLPKRLNALGSKRPFFRFSIEEEQQSVLALTARMLNGRALFVYAAPAFATSRELFTHQTAGTLVEQSTFPDVLRLETHTHWYYAIPGATGVLNAGEEFIELPMLAQRIEELVHQDIEAENSTPSEELAVLAGSIRRAIGVDAKVEPSARRAHLSDDWRRIEQYAERVELPRAASAFLEIYAFTRRFNLEWFVAGGSQEST